MSTKTGCLVFLFVSIFIMFSASDIIDCQQLNHTYFPPPESEGGWRKNTNTGFIRSLGIDPEKFEEFGQYNLSVENSSWMPYAKYKGIIVIKDGWVIGEWYNTPEAETFKTYISSNGKSFAMAGFGVMADDSKKGVIDTIISPQSKVYDPRWLPEGFPLSDLRKKNITFEQIFRHTSGLCPERTASGEDVEKGRNKWTDYVGWVVGHDAQWPQTGKLYFTPGKPGEYNDKQTAVDQAFAYSSVGFCHLGLVFRNIYNHPAHEFLLNRVLEPIGFSGIDYHAPPGGGVQWFSAGGVRMTPPDYARFAYLLLRDGRWKDEQIVDASWIQKFRTSPYYPNIRSNVDGYFGEQYPEDMFRIAGSGLNWAYIIPSLDLIALRTSRANNSQWDEVQEHFLQKLFAAVNDNRSGKKKKNTDNANDRSNSTPLPGQIIVDPGHPQWLRRNGAGQFFMAGPGDPEGFLYRGELNPDGTRSGGQMKLIDKLKNTGANCIYLMAVRSHGGDGGKTENPFVENDPSKGINMKVLDRWEQWFTEMDKSGIVTFFIFYDDDASVWDTGDSVGDDEKKFIHTLVNRFEHHKNLIWCIAEEYQEGLSVARVKNIAAEIQAADDHGHVIAVHKLSGLDFSEFADDRNIGQFAIQYNAGTPDSLHHGVVAAWEKAAGRYNLNMSEAADHGTGTVARKKNWACAMGGAYVMILGMDIASTPMSDLEDCGRMVRFFESTNFNEMAPHDELKFGSAEYVLAKPGESYIVYSSKRQENIGLKNIAEGTYSFQWFDCVDGKNFMHTNVKVKTGNHIWQKPEGFGDEIAVYISRIEQ